MSTLNSAAVNADYLKLIRQFPLVHIKNDRHLRRAHAVIDKLSIVGEENLSAGQLDYLLALGDLTTVYEQNAVEVMTRKVGGLELLKHMAEEHRLTGSDIGRIVGHRELGAKLLSGDRRISRDNAKALGERFGISAEIFMR